MLASAALAQGFRNGVQDALGGLYHENPYAQRADRGKSPHDSTPMGMMRHWNEIAVNASGLDHTPVASGEQRVFGEQLGPARASRAMAIVHIAVFDAVNAIAKRYRSYTGLPAAPPETSMEAAIAQASHDTLSVLFPSQKTAFDEDLARDLSALHGRRPIALGIELGQRAAAAILALRATDGSAHAEPRVGIEFLTGRDPGDWRQDPVSRIPIALGAYWDEVRPFVMASSTQFRAPPPPALDSAEYARAFAEVKALGGDGVTTRTAHLRADRDGDLLGLRRHAEPVRTATPVQPDRDADRRQHGLRRRRAVAAARAHQYRDGRRRHRDLGIEVSITSSGDR